jgi:hypothetical protein
VVDALQFHFCISESVFAVRAVPVVSYLMSSLDNSWLSVLIGISSFLLPLFRIPHRPFDCWHALLRLPYFILVFNLFELLSAKCW